MRRAIDLGREGAPLLIRNLRQFIEILRREHELMEVEVPVDPHLEGIYRHGLLRLSVFDGHTALLLHARAQPDGTLQGAVWIADQARHDWAARR